MKITIQIKGVLADSVSQGLFEKELDTSITLAELEHRLRLPLQIPSFASVNGTKGTPDTVLRDGDTVVFVPIVGGG
jgi:molybdopterin converting factor small subunit